jgi:hypothetical protein
MAAARRRSRPATATRSAITASRRVLSMRDTWRLIRRSGVWSPTPTLDDAGTSGQHRRSRCDGWHIAGTCAGVLRRAATSTGDPRPEDRPSGCGRVIARLPSIHVPSHSSDCPWPCRVRPARRRRLRGGGDQLVRQLEGVRARREGGASGDPGAGPIGVLGSPGSGCAHGGGGGSGLPDVPILQSTPHVRTRKCGLHRHLVTLTRRTQRRSRAGAARRY